MEMEQKNSNGANVSSEGFAVDKEINLLELLLIVVHRKKMILWISGVTFVLTCVVTLFMSNTFISTAKIMAPSEEKNGLPSLTSGIAGLASFAGISVPGQPGERYVGMLRSRTISDVIIDRFGLMEIYGKEYRVKTYDALNEHVNVEFNSESGILSLSIEDVDPQRAADIANTYVEELKKMNIRFNLASAGRERSFLEKRLSVIKKDLVAGEDALKDFLQKNKAIKIDDQAAGVIEAIAELKGQLASKEIQLSMQSSFKTEQNLEIRSLQQAIGEIKAQITKLTQPSSEVAGEDVFVSTAGMPELGVQYPRLLRDFKVQETLYGLLTQQYELAKISEAKNTSTIQVLDEAVPADRKSKPKRTRIVLVTTFLAGLLAVFTVFILEAGDRMSAEDQQRWRKIKSGFKSFKNG